VEGNPVLGASLGRQETPGHVVAGEYRGGHAAFRAHVGDGGPFRDRQERQPAAAVFEDPPHVAFGREDAEDLEDDVLGCNPGGQLALEFNPEYSGGGQIKGPAGHGQGYVQAAGAHGEHGQGPGRRRMTVGTDQGLSRDAEAFQMDLMADPVARPGEVNPEPSGDALKIAVVVGIFIADLNRVVIDVTYRQLGTDFREIHGLELQIGHGPRGILGEGLIDADADLPGGAFRSGFPMSFDNLFNDGFSHNYQWLAFPRPLMKRARR